MDQKYITGNSNTK